MKATAPARPEDQPATAAPPTLARRVVLYGDFNCPWSYLASRRAALLAAVGVVIDWRAVEHDPPHRGTPSHASTRTPATQLADIDDRQDETPAAPARLGPLLDDMQQVLTLLLPGEELPYALAGFAPHTGAAVTAYAEAYRSGAA